ncbi:MAG: MetQ/NlpA family ABC transporter substrate-binding protein [Limosilactobacillus sp.]|uniref:MetQ/NlpA family ABC transporter substrate-binding protein n=1 Tax=Limosilactobacillus sp. TaxID=2773925 RepID=UPI0026FFA29B|nr:MetQ/NlpA family ABC transporter substrate-binding protein [Limosilactobacillus sp.]
MKKKKQRNAIIWAVVAIVVVIAGYFSFVRPQQQSAKTVTVGIMASSKGDDAIWNATAKKAKKDYGITIKFKRFTDYNQPNKALTSGNIDLNAFQSYNFLNNWNETHKTNIVSIGNTFITPIRVYSHKYKSVKDLPNGATIAIPNDATNEARALNALVSAGLFKLDKNAKLPTANDIIDNKKNIKIKEVGADQTPRSLDDVDAAVVNANYAQAAGLDYKTAIFVEPLNKKAAQYVNFIAANKKDKNNKVYKQVVKAYQTETTKKLIQKYYGTSELPAWDRDFSK